MSSVMMVLTTGVLLSALAAAPEGFAPITPDNAARVRPWASSVNQSLQFWFSQDSSRLVIESIYSRYQRPPVPEATMLWDLATGGKTAFPPDVPLALSADGRWLALRNHEYFSVYRVNQETGERQMLVAEKARYIAMSHDGLKLATVSQKTDRALIEEWDIQTGIRLTAFPDVSSYKSGRIEFTADDRYLILSGNFGLLSILDTQENRSFELTMDAADAVVVPNSRYVLTTNKTTLTVWQVESKRPLKTIKLGERPSFGTKLKLSPDGRIALVHPVVDAQGINHAQVWDIRDPGTPELLGDFKARPDVDFVFSPTSTVIAAYDRLFGSTVRLINVADGREQAVLHGHQARVYQVAFNRAGNLLITAAYDETIRLWGWDGRRVTLLNTLPGTNFALSPDETSLAAALVGRVVVLYGVPTDQRPPQPFVVPAQIVPSSVNVRVDPQVAAPTKATAKRGKVLVGARDAAGQYVYVLDYGGWIRAGAPFIRFDPPLPLDWLAVLDTQQSTTLLPMPTPNPTPAR
jgi:WD40 repeat protein